MLKAHMDLTKSDKLLATLTWHKLDENGAMLDIGFDWTDDIDEDMKKRVTDICAMPLTVPTGKAFPGQQQALRGVAEAPRAARRQGADLLLRRPVPPPAGAPPRRRC